MSKLLIGLGGLVVGAVAGALFGGAVIGGTAAGVGIATGLSAGICSTVTAEQVDQVLNRAAADVAAAAGTVNPEAMVGSADECVTVMDSLAAAE